MRKFTKDISALLASVAVSAAAFAGAVSASSEQGAKPAAVKGAGETTTTVYETTHTVGTMTAPDETTKAYESEPNNGKIGTEMPETTTEPDTNWMMAGETMTDPIGTMMPAETTTTPDWMTEPIGTMMAAETTTTPDWMTEPVGTMMGPDSTTTTTVTTETTTDIPPMMGVIAPLDGDFNGDGEFGVTDVVVFQKWMHGVSKTKTYDTWAADLNYDGELDTFDLSLMKRKLIQNTVRNVVEPENHASWAFMKTTEKLTMYLGPDTSYGIVGTIPNEEEIQEMGYQTGNKAWMYTEYNGKKGWVRLLKADNKTPTVYYWAEVDKPVIYLYPEQKTDVSITLELTESELATTYPKYQNGWNVTAYPDGTLLNKADSSHHKYLFWDSVNCSTRFDFSKGFCVAGSDTERFLKEKLTAMGMTEGEMNEFIVYWLPRMEHNAYNLIAFQGDAYTNSAKLHITPAPDSVCRVFMAYIPQEKAVKIEPQQLASFERKGFTVVEWGGVEIGSPNKH